MSRKMMHDVHFNLFFSPFDAFSRYEYLTNTLYRGKNSFRNLRLMRSSLNATTTKRYFLEFNKHYNQHNLYKNPWGSGEYHMQDFEYARY
eukprot:11174726-Lingulodinium_polyedra.AAC.1